MQGIHKLLDILERCPDWLLLSLLTCLVDGFDSPDALPGPAGPPTEGRHAVVATLRAPRVGRVCRVERSLEGGGRNASRGLVQRWGGGGVPPRSAQSWHSSKIRAVTP